MSAIKQGLIDIRHYIVLPNGRRCGVGRYARAWVALLAMAPESLCPGFDHFPEPAREILAAMHGGLADRINRHLPWYGRGRKWKSDYQIALWRDSRAVRDRVERRVRVYQFETIEARSRFSHLLAEREAA